MTDAPDVDNPADATTDPYDDGLSWHDWFISLPLDPFPAKDEDA